MDDQDVILFAMREYFTLLGYEVECTNELEQAVTLIGQRTYSLVIADLRLTGSRGAEGLEIVRALRGKSPSARVIMLTAYGSPEVEAEAKRCGVDAFLHKPQPLADVARLAERLLKGLRVFPEGSTPAAL
ncbi:MAG: response regulator [Acidobacteriia bacterium]|nr:response regulator [Terriglobia bacterium]